MHVNHLQFYIIQTWSNIQILSSVSLRVMLTPQHRRKWFPHRCIHPSRRGESIKMENNPRGMRGDRREGGERWRNGVSGRPRDACTRMHAHLSLCGN
ncbi:hypothetical protein PUN28_015862 [Cardiocondyla obscurior]|uniref:Uncharacterized protein n=1 Tax=Cardiocondyla obscurior TaxID=286306 RepID=A0AAW2ES46_9HYME